MLNSFQMLSDVCFFFVFCYLKSQDNRAIAEIQFADYIFPAFDQVCVYVESCTNTLAWHLLTGKFLFCRSSMKLRNSDTEVVTSSTVEVIGRKLMTLLQFIIFLKFQDAELPHGFQV